MALLDKLNQDMKAAMKEKNKSRLSIIRMLKGSLQKEQIDKGQDLTAEEELTIMSRELKQRKDSVAEFRAAGRDDLADSTEAELSVVEEYLPKQLSDEEIAVKVQQVIAEVGATSMKDFGKVMGTATSQMKGQADGNAIQQHAKKLLSE